MAKQRPTAITTVAIINILLGAMGVFGVIGLVFSMFLLSGGGLPGQQPNPGVDMQQYIVREVPSYTTFTIVGGVLLVFAATAALASGIGLLGMRPWARKLCIAYGIYLLLHQTIAMVYQSLLVFPVISRWQADFAQRYPRMPTAVAVGAQIGLYVGVCFAVLYVGYGLFLILLMTRASTRAAFSDEPSAPIRPEDDYDRQFRY